MQKDDFKKELKEILELVKLCPQNLQEKCFEILLNSLLKGESHKPPVSITDTIVAGVSDIPNEVNKRIKVFTTPNGISDDLIRKVFSIDELGNISIEVTDLKSNKTSRRQKNLALLIGIRHQFMEGSFDVPTEELREMCVTYGTYDAANFTTNLKAMKEIFAGFKPGTTNKLSPIGKKLAADLVKELAS